MRSVHPAFDAATMTWFTDEPGLEAEADSLAELQVMLGARVAITGYVPNGGRIEIPRASPVPTPPKVQPRPLAKQFEVLPRPAPSPPPLPPLPAKPAPPVPVASPAPTVEIRPDPPKVAPKPQPEPVARVPARARPKPPPPEPRVSGRHKRLAAGDPLRLTGQERDAFEALLVHPELTQRELQAAVGTRSTASLRVLVSRIRKKVHITVLWSGTAWSIPVEDKAKFKGQEVAA